MEKAILIFTSILTLISCSDEIDLDKEIKTEFTFDQLPEELKEIYGSNFPIRNDSIDYYVFSLDKDYNLNHYWTGMNKQLLTKGFNHHFVINGKEFKLGANQGDPFVLWDKKLYYSTELNLAQNNFTQAKFIEIDLTEHLNE
ncbi:MULTISPECIES: hypothetical protein [unclassified Leeuwenhoekiella]|uniref:hypothetical protein n=1 Tax=unclassified Leeuwenhoekiella TaxID=2615029 RepID=UPI000C3AAF40|nr:MULTISPECIES: hypothetical protein [unclassified Leeuwenhoekiella]MAW95009.1 hypothetical protein [Leeuwenhoekiella sp.]MBA79729.1 hypothetical protein [Leeuwenhoekiella sp.]|tara:strand:- start:20443 stop:20868 length:426 start_codon:yes stop_codon:yes gene_type:complete